MVGLKLKNPGEIGNGSIKVSKLLIDSATVHQSINMLRVYTNGCCVIVECRSKIPWRQDTISEARTFECIRLRRVLQIRLL